MDYQINVYKAGFWLLEAKEARCADPAHPPAITGDMIGQAHFYAHHREIDCPLFGVSNGWWTNFYDRDADDPTSAILSIFHSDVAKRFDELYGLLGASQVTFWIKRRLLARIEQVLSADVDLKRTDEFVREAKSAASRAQPKVLENFRKNAGLRKETQSKEFIDYLETSRPYDVLDNLLLWPLNMGSMNVASAILAKKVAQYPGANQLLFFHKLLVKEPRPVTIDYYFNALNVLGMMCHNGAPEKVDTRGGGKAETPVVEIYIEFVRLLLFHLAARPDLQVIWTMEGLLKRMAKRALLSSRTARMDIAAGVEMERYFRSEEEISYLGPSPARTLVQAVESVTLAELGAFVSRHNNKDRNRTFDVRGAVDEFQTKRAAFEPLEDATDAAYQELIKSLDQEWREMTWSDHLNRTWDRLGHGVCEIILSYRAQLKMLPEDCRQQLVELSRLGNSFAQKCIEELGIDVPPVYPDAHDRLRAIFSLGARAAGSDGPGNRSVEKAPGE